MEAIDTQAECYNYDRLIDRIYWANYSTFKNCFQSYEADDFKQEMRVVVLHSIEKYDADKGASLSTYVIQNIVNKAKDLKKSLKKRSQRHIGFFDDLVGTDDHESDLDADACMNLLTHRATHNPIDKNEQEKLANIIDLKIILENIDEEDRQVFLGRKLEEKQYDELQKDFPHIKSKKTFMAKVDRVSQIAKTLIFQ